MSDKWEVVGTAKPRKPRPANGSVTSASMKPVGVIPGNVPSQRPVKRKKHVGPRDSKIAKLPGSDDEEEEIGKSIDFVGAFPYTNNLFLISVPAAPKLDASKPVKKQATTPQKTTTAKPKEVKPRDLESALKNVITSFRFRSS
jgi:hypothetical protein